MNESENEIYREEPLTQKVHRLFGDLHSQINKFETSRERSILITEFEKTFAYFTHVANRLVDARLKEMALSDDFSERLAKLHETTKKMREQEK
jgi:hypothetical protein